MYFSNGTLEKKICGDTSEKSQVKTWTIIYLTFFFTSDFWHNSYSYIALLFSLNEFLGKLKKKNMK